MQQKQIDLSELWKSTAVDPSSGEATARLIVDCHCELGEGVIFDDRKQAVLWTDILASRFHKLQLNAPRPENSSLTCYDLPKKLGSFGMLELKSDTLPVLCAWEDSFQLYDMEEQKAVSKESTGEDVNPAKGPTRMNDGRVDPSGKFFVSGGYYGDVKGELMKVYQCGQRADGSLFHEPIIEGVEVTNSLCWSLDGSTMYFADSPTRQIQAYAYDSSTGAVSSKKLLHHQNIDKHSVPDGSTIDSEGFLWNAVWRGGTFPGMVHRIDPVSGQVVFTVHMPDATSQVTCSCFGGPDLDILFITTAGESRDPEKEPYAGGLYAVRLPFKGRKESRLKFKV
jgi:L-arabinonolactonase